MKECCKRQTIKIAKDVYRNVIETPEGELAIWKVVLDKIFIQWLDKCEGCDKPLLRNQRRFCTQKCLKKWIKRTT